MLVSTDFPLSDAVIEMPLPMWQEMILAFLFFNSLIARSTTYL